MATLKGLPVTTQSRPRDARTLATPSQPRRSKRALFGGADTVSYAAQRLVGDENEAAKVAIPRHDVPSEHSDSESEFEPSSASERESSGSDDERPERARVGRKRKRQRSIHEATRAGSLPCSLCDVVFASSVELQTHLTTPHEFMCDIEGCARRFADETRAIQHVQTSHDAREKQRFKCVACHKLFLTLHDLHLHSQQTSHTIGDPPLRLFVCEVVPTCRQTYKKKDKLVQHTRRYHAPNADGSVFECSRCDTEFATRHERERHADTEHPGLSRGAQTPCFSCEFVGCGKSYSKREHLKRHVLATHDAPQEKPFGCDLCGVRFVYKHALTRHYTNCHTTDVEKPYACSVCLLAFKKKSLLQAHSFVHTGVLPFECEDCGERFLKRFQLGRHARKHASAKPSQTQVFMCEDEDCGELLFSLDEKNQHMREVHGVEVKEDEPKPAESKTKRGKPRASRGQGTGRELCCLVCNQVFARMQNLRSHLRTHFEAIDERKLHACPMDGCAKAYTKKSNLMAHYNAVHDPVKSVRFKCPYDGCDGAFGYKKVLQTHIASIHEKAPVRKKEKDEEDEAASDWESSDAGTSCSEGRQAKSRQLKRRKGREAMGVLARVLGNECGARGEDDDTRTANFQRALS